VTEFGRGTAILVPGVTDALQARLAAEVGFESVYVSGAATAAVHGYADVGAVYLGELVDATRVVVDASGLGAVVDFDAGFGNIHSTRRGASDLAAAGAVAIQIEDQPADRRCGYLRVEPCVSIDVMLDRLAAVREGAPDVAIIARTDALLVSGLEDALQRVQAYTDHADLLLVNGITALGELERLAAETTKPLVHNVSGSDRAPNLGRDQAAELGIAALLYPIQVSRAATAAAAKQLTAIYEGSIDPAMTPFVDYMDLAGWSEAIAFENRVAETP
jgi:2-methylisocitrate lyase-like PEP mutase family enzyme